jgi:hypothetical protein
MALTPCLQRTIESQGLVLQNLEPGSLTLQSDWSDAAENNIPKSLAIYQINQQKQIPQATTQMDVPDSPCPQTPDAAHTFRLTAVWPIIFKDYTACVKTNAQVPLLTKDELNYFKSNGNNATVFIHGYNDKRGQFGHLPIIDPQATDDNVNGTEACNCFAWKII